MIPGTFDELERRLVGLTDASLADFWRSVALAAMLERMTPDAIEAAFMCGRPVCERQQRRFRNHLASVCRELGITYEHRRHRPRKSVKVRRFEVVTPMHLPTGPHRLRIAE